MKSFAHLIENDIDNDSVWLITGGRYVETDPAALDPEAQPGRVREYRISEFARYLLNPNPIEVKKRLVGGEIHYRKGVLGKLGAYLRSPRAAVAGPVDGSGEIVVSRFKLSIPQLKDPGLQAHLQQISDQLRDYDSFAKRLSQLDVPRIAHVMGICEDIGGNFSYLKLQGSAEEKITYLTNSISKKVGVILQRAYLADGLFELRGFDFPAYRAANSFRLLTYPKKGQLAACVLAPDDAVELCIGEPILLKYMHLLEQCLRADPQFQETLDRCVRGELKPVKLFFNNQLEIDYAKANFPAVYREVFQVNRVDVRQRNLVKPVLNFLQTGISLSYLDPAPPEGDRLCTHIVVLHDFRALDSLKKNLPAVYSEIGKRLSVSEAGRYYLLDSIKGYSNA